MRPPGRAAELKRRRKLAISHLHHRHSVPFVAEMLGVSERAVFYWQAATREQGPEGVKSKPPPPRAGKLSPARERQVLSWFRKSPKSFGFAIDLWTGRRVAKVIRCKWGIDFSWRYLLGWLKDRGITSQKPQRRAGEVDRDTIDRWRSHAWPRLQNRRVASGPPLCSSTNPASC